MFLLFGALEASSTVWLLFHIFHYYNIYDIRYSEHHLLLLWAVTMVMIECHASEIHQENFITSIVMVTVVL